MSDDLVYCNLTYHLRDLARHAIMLLCRIAGVVVDRVGRREVERQHPRARAGAS